MIGDASPSRHRGEIPPIGTLRRGAREGEQALRFSIAELLETQSNGFLWDMWVDVEWQGGAADSGRWVGLEAVGPTGYRDRGQLLKLPFYANVFPDHPAKTRDAAAPARQYEILRTAVARDDLRLFGQPLRGHNYPEYMGRGVDNTFRLVFAAPAHRFEFERITVTFAYLVSGQTQTGRPMTDPASWRQGGAPSVKEHFEGLLQAEEPRPPAADPLGSVSARAEFWESLQEKHKGSWVLPHVGRLLRALDLLELPESQPRSKPPAGSFPPLAASRLQDSLSMLKSALGFSGGSSSLLETYQEGRDGPLLEFLVEQGLSTPRLDVGAEDEIGRADFSKATKALAASDKLSPRLQNKLTELARIAEGPARRADAARERVREALERLSKAGRDSKGPTKQADPTGAVVPESPSLQRASRLAGYQETLDRLRRLAQVKGLLQDLSLTGLDSAKPPLHPKTRAALRAKLVWARKHRSEALKALEKRAEEQRIASQSVQAQGLSRKDLQQRTEDAIKEMLEGIRDADSSVGSVALPPLSLYRQEMIDLLRTYLGDLERHARKLALALDHLLRAKPGVVSANHYAQLVIQRHELFRAQANWFQSLKAVQSRLVAGELNEEERGTLRDLRKRSDELVKDGAVLDLALRNHLPTVLAEGKNGANEDEERLRKVVQLHLLKAAEKHLREEVRRGR